MGSQHMAFSYSVQILGSRIVTGSAIRFTSCQASRDWLASCVGVSGQLMTASGSGGSASVVSSGNDAGWSANPYGSNAEARGLAVGNGFAVWTRSRDPLSPYRSPALVTVQREERTVIKGGPRTSTPVIAAPTAQMKDGPSGDILGRFDQRMKFWRRDIAQKLERGVDRFGGPDGYDSDHQSNPLETRNAECESQSHYRACSRGVNPSIVL
jgi:hypothetical protein